MGEEGENQQQYHAKNKATKDPRFFRLLGWQEERLLVPTQLASLDLRVVLNAQKQLPFSSNLQSLANRLHGYCDCPFWPQNL